MQFVVKVGTVTVYSISFSVPEAPLQNALAEQQKADEVERLAELERRRLELIKSQKARERKLLLFP